MSKTEITANNGQYHIDEKPKRRVFLRGKKLAILDEIDRTPDQLGLILRREGLYSSQLYQWRLWRKNMGNPKSEKGDMANELARVRRENLRLAAKLERAAHTSPGQRPRDASSFHPALKGQTHRCLAPLGLRKEGRVMAVNLEELPLPDELPVIPDGWRYESLGDLVDCMVALPGQLFYSTTIPVCLWILAKKEAPTPS